MSRSHHHTDLDARLRDYSQYTEVRQLAYNVAALQREKMLNSIAVLSYFHGEGKTLFCAALALAYAETCRANVLVVDTTLIGTPDSLSLKSCLGRYEPRIKVVSMAEQRKRDAPSALLSMSENDAQETDHELDTAASKLLATGSDFSVIMDFAKESPDQFGLVLLDTMPLSARNKNNVDPRLVARLANASILLVSQKLLNAPKLNDQLKIVTDPSLHLLGVVANEEFDQ